MNSTHAPVAGLSLLMMSAGALAQAVVPGIGSDVFSSPLPFDVHQITFHQVFEADAIQDAAGTSGPVQIHRIALRVISTGSSSTVPWECDLAIRFGYSDRSPAQGEALGVPVFGGGGKPNAKGPMYDFYREEYVLRTLRTSEFYTLAFEGTPFNYDRRLGNLLMEIVCLNNGRLFNVLLASQPGPVDAGLAANYEDPSSGDPRQLIQSRQGMRVAFFFDTLRCYADCDESGDLTLFDFLCFQSLFAAPDIGADCDRDGLLTLLDFLCFQNSFAQGCP